MSFTSSNRAGFLTPGHGALEYITPGNPGAGNNYTFSVPASQIWLPCTIRFAVATDGTVADRNITVYNNEPGSGRIAARVSSPTAVTASQTRIFYFMAGYPTYEQVVSPAHFLWLWDDHYCQPTSSLYLEIGNIQAGDTMTDIVLELRRWRD